MGPDDVGLAIFVLLLSAAHLVSAQSETAILDMYVDCIEFEKLCGELKPCENGAKCSPTYNDDGYRCDCPLGYGGKNCETKQSESFLPSCTNEVRLLPHSLGNSIAPSYTSSEGWSVFDKLVNNQCYEVRNIQTRIPATTASYTLDSSI